MKAPAEAEALKAALVGAAAAADGEVAEEEAVERLELMLADNADRAWCAPFAWSVLAAIYGYKGRGGTERLGRAAWLCCGPIQSREADLTLQPLDFDKLLSNMVYRLLEPTGSSSSSVGTSRMDGDGNYQSFGDRP